MRLWIDHRRPDFTSIDFFFLSNPCKKKMIPEINLIKHDSESYIESSSTNPGPIVSTELNSYEFIGK